MIPSLLSTCVVITPSHQRSETATSTTRKGEKNLQIWFYRNKPHWYVPENSARLYLKNA